MLEIKDLATSFYTEEGVLKAVDGVNLSIGESEFLGLVGESGSGKSVIALSILRLVPYPGKIVAGQILFEGKDLLKLSMKDMRDIRGGQISMIFQDPTTSLNPIFTAGYQVGENIVLHQKNLSKPEVREKIIEISRAVGIHTPERMIDHYPHQLSGGMKQRFMIAMALSCNPRLLIADEPTTNLDVSTQAQILDLIRGLREKFHSSILLITHDLGITAEMCDKVAVIYRGDNGVCRRDNDLREPVEPLHASPHGICPKDRRVGQAQGYPRLRPTVGHRAYRMQVSPSMYPCSGEM